MAEIVLHAGAVIAAVLYLLFGGLAATGLTEAGTSFGRPAATIAGGAVALTAFATLVLVLRHALTDDPRLLGFTALAPAAAIGALLVGGSEVWGVDPDPVWVRALQAAGFAVFAALPGLLSAWAASL